MYLVIAILEIEVVKYAREKEGHLKKVCYYNKNKTDSQPKSSHFSNFKNFSKNHVGSKE